MFSMFLICENNFDFGGIKNTMMNFEIIFVVQGIYICFYLIDKPHDSVVNESVNIL